MTLTPKARPMVKKPQNEELAKAASSSPKPICNRHYMDSFCDVSFAASYHMHL